MASDFESVVTRAAEDAGLDPAFVTRLVKAESNWNPSAVSPKGAVGLMQIMPETGKRYGVTNLTDPTQNVRAGIAYLSDLQKKYPGRPDLIAAAYNAGEGAVDKAGGVPKFAETQGYVEKVDPFAKYATPSSPPAAAPEKEEDPFAKYVGATPPPTAAQMLANVPIDEAGNPLKPTTPGQPTGDFWQNLGSELRGFTRGELPAGWKGSLREQLESAAHPQTAGTLAGLTIPGAPEVSGAIRGAIDVAPTVARAGIGYALGGIHGAEAALVSGPIWRWIKGSVQAVQEAKTAAEAAGSSASKVLQAIKDADTTMQAQFFKSAVNRVAAGEDASKVIKEYAGKTAATTAEIKAGEAPAAAAPSMPAHMTPKDVIPLPESVPRLQTVVEGLPQIAPPPPPNVAPPIAAVAAPAETLVPLKHDAWRQLPTEPEYLYHATSMENLEGIKADQKLKPHGPSYGTDQSQWPDGSTAKRSYFTDKPATAWQFAPEEGKPVLLKIRRDAAPFRRESTGDFYLSKPIDAQTLSAAHQTGDWVPVVTPEPGAFMPKAWGPYTGQTELGQVLPAQPPGRTMSGAPQASRPFVPPATRPSQSPAGAVNMAMKETGLRIPARVMDAAIRRVRAGEDAVDVVKSYAEVK